MAGVEHVPQFTWRVLGGSVNHEQWVYDREEPVARFDSCLVEQPEQALRYFNQVERPLILRRLRLTPAGVPLVEGVQLYWVLRRSATISGTRAIATDRLTDMEVKGEGSDHLALVFSSRDRGGIAASTTHLSLAYDRALGSYVYGFRSVLDVFSPEDLCEGGETRFEYSDPWLADLPAPAVSLPGAWEGRYQRLVYEAPNGEVLQVPLNHFESSHKSGILVKEDGLIAAVYEPSGNPAFQFLGETARRTELSVCAWGYDVHFTLRVGAGELSRPVEAQYRVFQLDAGVARRMAEAARLPALKPGELPLRVVPAYEREGSFRKPCDVDRPYEGVDPWPWMPLCGEGHAWDTTTGRSDGFSLRIGKEDAGLSQWGVRHEGAGGWMGPWLPRRRIRVSCYAKTSGVEGAGSSVAARYNVPNEPDIYRVVSSSRLRGTNGWTRLQVELEPAPEDAYFVHIFLRQEGRGTTWFDDLKVEYLG